MADIIQIRRDTAANWSSTNPTLANGEMGLETDTLKAKVGDGSTVWNSLSYWFGGGSDPVKVKVSSNDSTEGYLEDKIVVSDGSNSANILEKSTLNDGADEDVQIQIDESKINHTNLLNLTTGDPHTQYQQESEKSAANGYASLDATTKVPTAELGTGSPGATNFLRGDRAWAVPDFSKVVFSSYKEGSTSAPSTTATTSGTAPVLAEMTHTFTPANAANKIEVFFSGSFENSKDEGAECGVFIDGVLEAETNRRGYAGNDPDWPACLSTVWQGTLSVASHTITIRFWGTDGTTAGITTMRSMLIREIAE